MMTRRLTLNSRSEMGLLEHPLAAPNSPPPVWSPMKHDFWRKPSKWQICMPRLRLIGKFVLSFVFFLVAFKILSEKSPDPKPQPQPTQPLAMLKEQNANEMWIWKDFRRHDALVRGTVHLQSCLEHDRDCTEKSPTLLRYDGYAHLHEPSWDIVPCIGPRGLPMNESDQDAVWAYSGTAQGAVDPVIGSYEASGLDGDVSFDRIGRFSAYGLQAFDTLGVEDSPNPADVDWDSVRWGDLQDSCAEANRLRFNPVKERAGNSIQYSNIRHPHMDHGTPDIFQPEQSVQTNRTAILIRVWTGAVWSADAVMNIRAMIAEASLASGGKYQVFILLHVKDDAVPLFVGEDQPQATIRKHVPPEFHSITEVWNHAQIRGLYSNLAEHAFVGRSPWMIVQWFARNHPEFDFFYQWEFDVRFTGHYLDFFEAVSNFGRQQPRKGIWERSGRVYIPSVHGEFNSDFRASTRKEDPHRIWGPVSVEGVRPRGPKPPMQQGHDDYEWGVGEDADWIGFLPSFNITDTNWFFRDHIWGYKQGKSTPRRATLIAQGRVSRRLLDIMNYENAENNHHIDAEMFPQTVALHHGLKSTTFPHPIFADRDWTADALQQTFNGGPFGQAGGYSNSTFSKWNEHAWTNMTWYYSSEQAMPVFQRLLGVAAENTGGSEWEDAYGRAVVRPMLLHPVKGGKALHWTSSGWVDTQGKR